MLVMAGMDHSLGFYPLNSEYPNKFQTHIPALHHVQGPLKDKVVVGGRAQSHRQTNIRVQHIVFSKDVYSSLSSPTYYTEAYHSPIERWS